MKGNEHEEDTVEMSGAAASLSSSTQVLSMNESSSIIRTHPPCTVNEKYVASRVRENSQTSTNTSCEFLFFKQDLFLEKKKETLLVKTQVSFSLIVFL